MFTDMWSVDPRKLELFTLPEIVDHLEYMGARRAQGGQQA
jgi:hypothetical protein